MLVEREKMLQHQVEEVLEQRLKEMLKELGNDCENEPVGDFRGLTYQEVKQYQLKKVEMLSKPIERILKNLLEMEGKVVSAKEALALAEEAYRTTLIKICDEVKTVMNTWNVYKSTSKERNCRVNAVAADVQVASPDVLHLTPESAGLSAGQQVSLSGSPFPSENTEVRSIEYKELHIKPLVFDESVVISSPAIICHHPVEATQTTSIKKSSVLRDSTSVALPEMPHFRSKTLRSLFENERVDNKENYVQKQLNILTQEEYDSLDPNMRLIFTMRDASQAIELLNEHILARNQDISHLSKTAVVAALIMKFDTKQCDAIYQTLIDTGRITR